jgi:hypothetical protein
VITRLVALAVATALGLVGAISLITPSADSEPARRTHFDDVLAEHHAGAHPHGAVAPNDVHTSHQEMP